MPRYEYRFMSFHTAMTIEEIGAALNEAGREGWLLMHIDVYAWGKTFCLMKMME